MSQPSLGEVEEASRQQQKLRSERFVVEVRHEGVHDRTTNCRGEHCCRHAGVRPRALSHEKPVQTIHHVPELFVMREESDDHRIAEERALHSTAFDRQIDDAFDQHLARG